MRILVVHNFYQQPGGERVAVEAQKNLLKKCGHKVISYTFDNTEINNYNFTQKIALFPQTFFSQKVYKEVISLLRKERPDVAHVHNVFPLISPAVYRAIKDAGIPIVQTLHNFRFLCPNGLFFVDGEVCERCKYGNTLHAVSRRCFRESYALSALYAAVIGYHRHIGTFQLIDRFIALTGFVAEKLLESGLVSLDRISVLGNFLPVIPDAIVEKRKPYIVYMGRLSSEKGINVLFEAVNGVSGLQLEVAGNGPYLQELEVLAQKLNLKQVHFIGHVDGEKKASLLKEAVAVIVPSVWYENFPYIVLESMAAGTPVIASNVGGLPFMIENEKSGLLFRPYDSVELRDKIQFLKNNPSRVLDMGHYAQQAFETHYTEEPHYNRLIQIYNEVLS